MSLQYEPASEPLHSFEGPLSLSGLAGFSKGPLLERLKDIAGSNFTRVSYTDAVEAPPSSRPKVDWVTT